jgi:hypothetical protein
MATDGSASVDAGSGTPGALPVCASQAPESYDVFTSTPGVFFALTTDSNVGAYANASFEPVDFKCPRTRTICGCALFDSCASDYPPSVPAPPSAPTPAALTFFSTNHPQGFATIDYADPGNAFKNVSKEAGDGIGAGEQIWAAASAGGFPGFMTPELVAPAPITLTSPSCDGWTCTVPANQDLVVRWTGGSVGNVYFAAGDIRGPSIACAFPVGDHVGLVPQEALALLHQRSSFSVYTQTEATFEVGSSTVNFAVRQNVPALGVAGNLIKQ